MHTVLARLLACSLGLAMIAPPAVAGESLYNGIELSDAWPPRPDAFHHDQPLTPPYLAQPPKVIPIDVGRQLFVDDFLIEESTLRRDFHLPVPHPENPVFRPDAEDYFVLKPMHSGFHGTPLAMLLQSLEVHHLILTGLAGNLCVLFTAHDAHMRGYQITVPRDCMASESRTAHELTLHQLGVLGIETPESDQITWGNE